ncbi:hypothetical protein DKX38_016692 [Salix brachista]|uniref:WLM domain-containing protein n=1 Tax=Salix brachista TaxID=2182728 RepID=A0A5N5L8N3_9ROSI|nr:hypothetical protein DKX38_016692 [Salix brachista]
MDLNELNKAWEIKPLKKAGEEDARKALERVAKQEQPIIKKTQMESQSPVCLSPVNPAHAGLNIGGGAEAKLRSRRPNNEWHFFPYEQILDTMSHELCHNNAVIAKSLECGELMAKGITGTGQGFDLPGRCLGGFSRQPPLSSLRPSALAATENRARRDALFPSDVQVVTAILRLHLAQHKLLPWLLKGDYTVTCGPSPSPQTVSLLLKELLDLQAQLFPRVSKVHCDCFLNCEELILLQPMELTCEACGTQRHKDVAKFKVWSCKFCTLDNSVELDRCEACGEWRYSCGPPVST